MKLAELRNILSDNNISIENESTLMDSIEGPTHLITCSIDKCSYTFKISFDKEVDVVVATIKNGVSGNILISEFLKIVLEGNNGN